MKAVVLDRITEAKDVALSEVPIPEARPGWVLVKVKAFGLNHSEKILRLNEIRADYIQKPVIPGIECVGEVADPSDSGLITGQKVWGVRSTAAMQNTLFCRKGLFSPLKVTSRGKRSARYLKPILQRGARSLSACA